jgi:beta-fructofuranosidase
MATAADMAATMLLMAVLLHCTGTAMVWASHAVYPELQSLEAEKVDETSRTGYHFQPPKHWINGTYVYVCVHMTICFPEHLHINC